MKAVVNTILYHNTPTHQHTELIEEAKRASSLGGYYQIRHYYSGNWLEEIIIYYPETSNG